MFPSGILSAVNGNDGVARLEARGIGGLRNWKSGNDDGLGKRVIAGETHGDVIDAEEQEWENEIDGGTGKRDQGALPTGFGEKLIRSAGRLSVAGVDIGNVLSGHADVAAERKGAKAPVGSATFDAKEARTEADGEDVDANAEEASDYEVSPFMNEDDDAEYDQADKNVH